MMIYYTSLLFKSELIYPLSSKNIKNKFKRCASDIKIQVKKIKMCWTGFGRVKMNLLKQAKKRVIAEGRFVVFDGL